MVQVVSLDIERDPREILMGPEQARGPKLCPVKNCLEGDGYLAPGRMATRALNRNQAQTNTHTIHRRQSEIQVPDTEQTQRTVKWK